MINSIHLFASLGDIKKVAAGGGQTSARRLVRVLESLDYTVEIVNRTIPPYTIETVGEKLYKIIGFVIDPIRYFFHLFFKSRKKSVAMLIGYSGNLFPYYFLFIKIGKLLGFKTIFYIKGGFTETKYNSFPNRIQNCYKKELKYADIALYEGEEGAKLSAKIRPETKSFWLPNYVEKDFECTHYHTKPQDTIKLLYFGRIHRDKNVIMIVDVLDHLIVNNNYSLTIVGSGETEYERLLDNRIAESPNAEKVERIPRIPHEKLKELLETHHFFVFPSVEKQEGHSNSLNEAMSYGLVPIVSDNNFLPSIVGNDRLVLHEMSAGAYAEVIEDVVKSGDYEQLSRQMFERVRSKFVQSIIEQKLKEIID